MNSVLSTLLFVIVGVVVIFFGNKILKMLNDEESEEDSEEEDEEEPDKCYRCKKLIREDDDSFSCDECGDELLCKNCVVEFENSGYVLCKKCLDKRYPQREKIVYKEKVVEVPQKPYKNGKDFPKYPTEPVEPIFEDSTEFD